MSHCCVSGPHTSYTENWELSWCQLSYHWWYRRLSLWQSMVSPWTTKLASWQFSVLSISTCWHLDTSCDILKNMFSNVFYAPNHIFLEIPLRYYWHYQSMFAKNSLRSLLIGLHNDKAKKNVNKECIYRMLTLTSNDLDLWHDTFPIEFTHCFLQDLNGIPDSNFQADISDWWLWYLL